MMKKLAAVTVAVIAIAGCTLYNEVQVRPLTYDATKIERGADIQGMLRKFDLNRAVQFASLIGSGRIEGDGGAQRAARLGVAAARERGRPQGGEIGCGRPVSFDKALHSACAVQI